MKNRACATRARALLGGTALFLLPVFPASATDWTGASSASWIFPGNWSAGVPTSSTIANINKTSPNATVVNNSIAATSTLNVGTTATGKLSIQAGATVTSSADSHIGFNAGSTGTVTVTGAGSNWTDSGDLYVGVSGTGTLNIQNGGEVHDAKGFLGAQTNAKGTVTVNGVGSKWINSGFVYVGDQGTGALTISNGGQVSSAGGGIGWLGGAKGTVTVDGAGSSWTSSAGMVVGGSESATGGVGTLTVTNGGKVVDTLRGSVAASAGSVGTVRIDGAGSTWSNGEGLTVGGYGTALLSIINGGKVSSEDGTLGDRNTGNALVIVSGAGSTWTVGAGGFAVGAEGSGTLIVQDGGAVNVGGLLLIANSAGSTGTLDIGAPDIQAPVAAGTVSATVKFGAGTGTINFKHTDPAYTFASKIQGLGTINQVAGNTILTGNSGTFTGTANVTGGRLTVDGTLGGSVSVQSGGTLAGSGTVGVVSVANGGTLAGVQGQTLTSGNLTLAAASNVNVALGAAGNATGLFKVNGNLTLDGTLNVSDAGGFGQGIYRIADYTGALTDHGMNVGMMPAGNNGAVQTAVANQVNLLVSVNDTQFWNGTTTTADGTIHGGNGTWIAGPTNWTDMNGAIAGAWGGQFAVFQNNPGTVTVDGSAGAIATTGMQFIGAGWTVAGAPITLNGASGNTTIRVGDGSPAGAAYSATIGSELTGASGLVKDDLGTLVLTGANSYTGGTIIGAGTLQIGNGGTSGSISGDVVDDGVLAFNRSDDLTFAGTITGSGSVKLVAGGVAMTGDNSYTGGTTIASGASLALGNGGTTGSITGDVTDNGELAFVRSDDTVFSGAITGSGSVQLVSGGVALTADNSYTGGTTIANGAQLAIGYGGTTGSIAGNVTDDGELDFFRSDGLIFAGTITGSGSVSVLGGGVELTGDNSYTGGTTIFGGSGLIVGDGGTTGSIAGNVADGGVLAFFHSNDLSFAGAISGSGTISQVGSGTTTLTGDSSSFGGLANVIAGTLRVDGTLGGVVDVQSGGTLAGSGTVGVVSVESGGTLAGAQGQTLSTGNLTLDAGSNLDVSLGAPGNTTGLFKVEGDLTLDGTLNVADAGGFGQGVYRIVDYSGALTDNGLDVGAMPGGHTAIVQTSISKQVNLVVDNGGPVPTVQFWNGTTTAADGTVHGGSGVWSAGPATNWTDASATLAAAWGGNFAVFENNPGTVTVDDSAGPISTTGMQFADAGWIVTGASITLNGAGGNTLVRVGDGTAAGASDTATIEAALTGGSALVKDDLGTLILTGANSYTGGTEVSTGTVQIGNGGTTGSIMGNVTDNGVLAFDRSNDFNFAGVVSGSGALRQIGSGKIELTGDSSGFTGETSIENGTLAVNGKLGGPLDVWNAGRLQGAGTVGGTVVDGTVAPGNSIGTLNVAGAIAFNPGSIYEAEVNAAGQADKIAATGAATINGGSVKVLAGTGNYALQTQYTIMSANGGVTGTFTDGVTSNLAFLDASLSYDANDVYLTMIRNDATFQNVGLTPNQIATGGGVESLAPGDPIYDAVLSLSADQARYAFDQLSGEIHPSVRTLLIEDSHLIRDAVDNRIRAAFDGAGASPMPVMAYADGGPQLAPAATDRFAVWGQGFGSWGDTKSDGNAARLKGSTGGFLVGADAPVLESWRLGVVAGYSHTSFDVEDRHSSGSSDNYHLGLYGGTNWGNIAFRSGAAYTWSDLSTDRDVAFPGFADSLKGDYNAGTAQVFGELGYGIDRANARFEPFANLAYVSVHTDGFAEPGGAAALAVEGATTDATFATLGLRASADFDLNGAIVTARGTLGWRHAFGDVTPLSIMRFGSGGDAFQIAGVPIGRDTAVVEAGFDYALSQTETLDFIYDGQFGSGVADQSVKADFNVKF